MAGRPPYGTSTAVASFSNLFSRVVTASVNRRCAPFLIVSGDLCVCVCVRKNATCFTILSIQNLIEEYSFFHHQSTYYVVLRCGHFRN
jgi:hypothetical protein